MSNQFTHGKLHRYRIRYHHKLYSNASENLCERDICTTRRRPDDAVAAFYSKRSPIFDAQHRIVHSVEYIESIDVTLAV